MKYITISDLSETIRKNLWKIPRDIDFIIGVPRSGMIAASMISSYLNVPLIDINSYIKGVEPSGGWRLQYFTKTHVKTNKALVIDDTVSTGSAMNVSRGKLSNIKDVNFIYMCVYLEGRGSNNVDLFLEDVRQYTNNFTEYVLYEWNIFQHQHPVTLRCLYDMDGVLCVDPPDERNDEEYIKYIENATPLFIPRTPIGGIVTYRLIKNKEITINWLKKQGINYGELVMFDANTWEERDLSKISPEIFKGDFYKKHDNYNLFIESNNRQAMLISEIANKPVLSVETNTLYRGM